ncbi:MAG: AtuA-related protein [Burkholderiales bacterium]
MAKLLRDIAYVRSGDKGDICTAGLIAKTPQDYAVLLRSVTPDKVKALYGDWIRGEVNCYPMDNIQAVVVVMQQALGGGATRTLRLDQTGKALGHALLRLPAVE